MSTIRKYWKLTLIGIMTVLLIFALIKISELKRINDSNTQALRDVSKRLDTQLEVAKNNRIILDSMSILLKNQKVVYVTTTNSFETIKKTPVYYNYSDAELARRLKEFRAKYGTGSDK